MNNTDKKLPSKQELADQRDISLCAEEIQKICEKYGVGLIAVNQPTLQLRKVPKDSPLVVPPTPGILVP